MLCAENSLGLYKGGIVMKIYTAQMAKGKKYPAFLDITVKTGVKLFTPS